MAGLGRTQRGVRFSPAVTPAGPLRDLRALLETLWAATADKNYVLHTLGSLERGERSSGVDWLLAGCLSLFLVPLLPYSNTNHKDGFKVFRKS